MGRHNEALVKGPGIVVGRKGTVGSILWIDNDFFPIDTTFFVKTELPLVYVYFLLKDQVFQTGDSAVPGLNRGQAYMNTVNLPSVDKILKFANLVDPMFKLMSNNKKQNQTLTSLRDTLLPKLMSGEVRV